MRLRPRTRFGWWVLAVAVFALGVRIVYVVVARRDFVPGGDAFYYHRAANLLADGKGFVQPYLYPRHVQAADHPPLYTLFLSIPSVLGMRSVLAHIMWSCVVGAATAVVAVFLGREVAGERTGVIAGVIVAIYPNMWSPDGMLQAETLAMFFVTLAVFLAYRYWKAPSLARLIWIGVVCGLAALTRSELVLLLFFLVLPLALVRGERPARERLTSFAAGAVGLAAVIAPWTIYNSTRFEHSVVLSTQMGPLLSAANCDSTYYGDFWGYFDINCTKAAAARARIPASADESEVDRVTRNAAFEYIRGHLSRLPKVEKDRLLRVTGLLRPAEYVNIDVFMDGREKDVAWSALYGFYAVSLLAVAGGVIVRRRRTVPVFPLLAPIGVFVFTTLATYASTRFRTTAEPVLVVLAAVAIDAALRSLPARRARTPVDSINRADEALSEPV